MCNLKKKFDSLRNVERNTDVNAYGLVESSKFQHRLYYLMLMRYQFILLNN